MNAGARTERKQPRIVFFATYPMLPWNGAPWTMNTDRIRSIAFFGVLVFVILIYLLVYGSYLIGLTQVSVFTLNFIISGTPVITGDISLFGEYTPPVLAGLMASTAPPRQDTRSFVLALVLAVIAYALYIHLTVFFEGGAARTLLEISQRDAGAAQKTIDAFVTGVRTFCVVVAAGLVGLRLNRSV